MANIMESIMAEAGVKQKSDSKTARIPIKIVPAERLKKPEWIRVKAGSPSTRFYEIKQILRDANLHTVCDVPPAHGLHRPVGNRCAGPSGPPW